MVGVRTLAVPHNRASLFHRYVGIGVKRDLKEGTNAYRNSLPKGYNVS